MKSMFLAFLCFVFLPFDGSCMLTGIFRLKNKPDEQSCYLHLNKSGTFSLILDFQLSDDEVYSYVLAEGNVVNNGQEILLKDNLIGFEILFKLLPNKQLLAIKGFNWMKNQSFVWQTDIDQEYAYRKYAVYDTRNESKSSNPKDYEKKKVETIYSGSYALGVDYMKLYLYPNHQFKLVVYDIVLSQGNWHQDKFVLTLADTALNFEFYMFIDGKSLIDISLPGHVLNYQYNLFK
jgi:hypothetical protein